MIGLIPAHAGKTFGTDSVNRTFTAHPRSRGENESSDDGESSAPGSSPLTRGKRRPPTTISPSRGLIPAHAGKTGHRQARRHPKTAHPRSRGENRRQRSAQPYSVGSSPLTRGKHVAAAARPARTRLIPAHAGKTASCTGLPAPSWAHPRSRGENAVGEFRYPNVSGLIPAHAGKTKDSMTDNDANAAHPRSRGENSRQVIPWLVARGSSPLTRGKQRRAPHKVKGGRLIPAHAGKTLPDLRFYCADRSDLGNP